jgi:hypothetical protein
MMLTTRTSKWVTKSSLQITYTTQILDYLSFGRIFVVHLLYAHPFVLCLYNITRNFPYIDEKLPRVIEFELRQMGDEILNDDNNSYFKVGDEILNDANNSYFKVGDEILNDANNSYFKVGDEISMSC